jgi:predicted transcriptional regulator
MWTEEREDQLLEAVGAERPVTQETAAAAAEALDVSTRSVSAKLRKMGIEVEKAGPRARVFSDEQADALAAFLADNAGEFTYAEIAEQFAGGEFTAKQIQGKVLSLELTDAVKPTPKKAVEKKYSEEEENTFVTMAKAGKFLEEIAEALGKTLPSVRGKALSLTRTEVLESIPPQRDKAPEKIDYFDNLGEAQIAEMTVAELSEGSGKTPRGVKTILTRRQYNAADYKAKKKDVA